MRILITGAAGFLGSHLSTRLVGEGHEVLGVDNLWTGRMENLTHLEGNPRFSFQKHDITSPLMVEGRIDRIYNLACPASPPHYQRDPLFTTRTCTLGVANMLDLAQAKGARFLQASTSEVYGDPLEHPQRESYRGNVSTTGPRACYDEGKRVAESIIMDHHRMHGTQVRIMRIFNTYGPRMDPQDGRVVSNFIVQALRDAPLTVYGDGSQTRSFCYVSDLIEGMIRLMEHPEFMGPVNIGNPGEFTILQLAQAVKRLTGSRSEIVFKDLPVDDPTKRRPDITLANEKLGWEPRVPLEEGLRAMIEFYRVTAPGNQAARS